MKTNVKTSVPGVRTAKSNFSSCGAIPAGWIVLCGWCVLLLLAVSAQGKTLTWSGGGVPNANWSASANWGGVGTPANGDTLVFSGSHTNAFVNTNNIASLSLDQIQFVGDNTFGVMFDLRGNAFTLTGSILATNVTGTNIIENNITLANASELIVVSNSDQLIIKGVLSGSGGVTKAGAGTLTYQCIGNNTYNGTTLVNDGMLQFNVSGEDAVSGPLVIGDGSGNYNATVEDLQNTEMNGGPSVTINLNGELNLNNFSEPFFSTSLTMSGGAISTGSGTLTLLPNTTLTANDESFIYGHLNLNGGVLTLQGNGYLYLYCAVGGTGDILQTGNADTIWIGANTYSGNYTANGSGLVALYNSQALGNVTNMMTLNDTAWAFVDGNINVTNQSLTINSTYYPTFVELNPTTNSWTSKFIINTPCTIDVGTNDALILNGPISGSASVTKINDGRLVFAGTNANTYAGTTTVEGGLLQLGKSAVVPAVPGALFVGTNATVRLLNSFQINNPFASITLSNSSRLDLAGFNEWVGPINMQGAQISSGAGFLYLSGNITVNSSTVAQSFISGNAIIWNGTCVVTNSGHEYSPDLVISANLSGGGSGVPGLIKDGSGEVTLTGNNTFPGPVTVNYGNLWAQSSTALGSTNFTATVNNGGTLFLDGSGLDFGLKPLVLYGTGWPLGGSLGAVMCSGSSSWEGDITLASDSGVYPYNAATLNLAGIISGPGGYTMNGPGTNIFSGSAGNTYSRTTTVNHGTLVLNKPAYSPAVPTNLVIASSGTVRLANNLQTAYAADVLVNAGGLFDLSTNYTPVNTLRGTGTVNFGTNGFLQIGFYNGSSEFDGSFTGIGSSAVFTVGKYGTGIFTNGGTSSYTAGIICVLQGEMVVNGYAGGIGVLVDGGATLAGSGTVGDITTYGTIAPGNPGVNPAILNSGNVTFIGNGNFKVDLTGPNAGAGGYDQLYAFGQQGYNSVSNAALVVVPAFTTPVTIGQQFVILNGKQAGPPCCTANDPVLGTFTGLPDGATFSVDGIGFQINYTTYQVVLTVVSLPPAPVITGIQPAGGGGFLLSGTGSTNLAYSVWATTNLTTTNWITIGSAMVPAYTNVFQFTDTNSIRYADRFYRFTWP